MIFIKKLFIIFVSFLILVSCMVLPCFAYMPNKFGDHPNYLNSNNLTTSRFYTSSTEFSDENFFYTYLKPDTSYTFYSTSGTKRLYIGEKILYNNFYSVFAYPSTNLLTNQPTESRGGSYSNYTFTQSFNTPTSAFKIQAFKGLSYIKTLDEFYVNSLGTSTISFTKDSSFSSLFIGFNGSYTDIGSFFDVSNLSNDTEYYLILDFLNLDLNSKQWNQIIISNDSDSSWMPGYIKPVYNDEFTYVYNFRTPSNITTDTEILVGINDVTQFNDASKFFSRYQASSDSIRSNDFYLIEGSFSPDELADVDLDLSYNSGYNSGYDDGYSKGETSGLESSMFMRNIFFTIVSSPFIFIRNALDFDFLGINFRDIAMIIISATLVAWVIRVFKKGE